MNRYYRTLPAFFFSIGILFTQASVKAEMLQGWEWGARTGLMWQEGTLEIRGNHLGHILNSQRDIVDTGFLGGVFAGYQWKEDLFTWALNLALDWNEIDEDHHYHAKDAAGDNFLVRSRYEREFFYGVSARMGYQASEFIMPFVRVGIERSMNRLRFRADNTNNPDIPILILDRSLSHHKTGYVLGLGVDIPVLYKNTHLRLEYQYHLCGDIHYTLVNNLFSAQAVFQPKVHFVTIGLQWGQL